MKLLKKVLTATAVLTLTFACVPAFAATDAVDFEDGNVPASIQMKTDDGGDVSKLSVADYNGSKQLFVDVQKGATMIPKLQIKVADIIGADNLDKVKSLQFDLSIVNPSKAATGWNGGAIGANIGADAKTWWQAKDWTLEEYTKSEKTGKIKVTFDAGKNFTKGVADSSFLFMKWSGSDNDMYIDNIQFLDADGSAIALKSAGTAAATTTDTAAATTTDTAAATTTDTAAATTTDDAAVTTTDDAAVTTTDDADVTTTDDADVTESDDADVTESDDADVATTDDAAVSTADDTTAKATDSSAPKTGETSNALFFAIGAAAMLAGAVVLKKSKSVEE